jgi:predicted dehydrogenase
MRKIRVFQRDAYFSIDFLEQRAAIFRHTGGSSSTAIQMEPLDLGASDPLDLELRAFLESVRTRETPEQAPEEALRALRTALRITDASAQVSEPEGGNRS